MKKTFGILAHVDAGKTTFSEQLLYHTNAVRSLGSVNDKNSWLDSHSIERARGITIFSQPAGFSYNGSLYYLVDTPGHTDFSSEMERTLRILDYAVLLVSGTDGIQGHTETIWNLLRQFHIPTFLFVNKLDRETSDYAEVLSQLKDKLSPHIADCMMWSGGALPQELLELAAESDEDLLEQYLEEELSQETAVSQLVSLVHQEQIFPCMGGSGVTGEGIGAFLRLFDCLTETDYQEDGPFRAQAFQIRYNRQNERLVYLKLESGSLRVKDRIGNEDKIHQIFLYRGVLPEPAAAASAGDIIAVTGLKQAAAGEYLGEDRPASGYHLIPAWQVRVSYPESVPDPEAVRIFHLLSEEDPMLRYCWEEKLKQLSIHIMGKIQLEILEQMIQERFGISVTFEAPELLYKETIAAPVIGYGHFEPLRHYAEAVIRMEPGIPGSGITFSSQCPLDRLSSNYQNLIRTHIFETAHRGVLTGSELTDIHMILVDGISHIKHTEGGDFREAVYRAIRQGLMKAENRLLEPYYQFRIRTPGSLTGRVLSDLTRNGGTFQPPQLHPDGTAIIEGTGPAGTFMAYGEELTAFSKGMAHMTLIFSHYGPCHNAEEVIASRQYSPDADTDHPSGSVFCQKGSSFLVNWKEAESYMHSLR